MLAGEHKDFFRFAELFGDDEEHLYHAEKKKILFALRSSLVTRKSICIKSDTNVPIRHNCINLTRILKKKNSDMNSEKLAPSKALHAFSLIQLINFIESSNFIYFYLI